MMSSKYPETKVGGISITNSKGLKPKHDQYSHLRSSFEYGALGLTQYKSRGIMIYDKFKKKDNYGQRKTRLIGY